MLAQPPVWFIAIAFIFAIGPLVFFHELGHYWVARWFGIGAEQFSIGFGREVVGWTDKRGTRWKVGWLPLGGYVRFIGDRNETSQAAPADVLAKSPSSAIGHSFHDRPVYQRFLVVLAGPVANFILAITIFTGFFLAFGQPNTPPVAASIKPESAAAAAGLLPGDQLTSIDGQSTDSFEDIQRIVSLRPGETVVITLVRGGESKDITATIGSTEVVDRFGQKNRYGLLGIGQPTREFTKMSLFAAVPAATKYTVNMTRTMMDGIIQIVTGKRSAKDMGGPLKMAQIAGQSLTLGPFEFVYLIALFSINLGFINLLPIPMLDGGHLMFYTAEAIRRKPVSERAQDWAFRGGLALLLSLVVFVTINDLSSFGMF